MIFVSIRQESMIKKTPPKAGFIGFLMRVVFPCFYSVKKPSPDLNDACKSWIKRFCAYLLPIRIASWFSWKRVLIQTFFWSAQY